MWRSPARSTPFDLFHNGGDWGGGSRTIAPDGRVCEAQSAAVCAKAGGFWMAIPVPSEATGGVTRQIPGQTGELSQTPSTAVRRRQYASLARACAGAAASRSDLPS